MAVIVMWLALCMEGAAQVNVRLRGTGDNLAGKTVELYCYNDMLTMEEQQLDMAVADSAGAFELDCYMTYPRLVFVQVDNYSQSFYAEPGRTYEVYLPEFRWEQDEERNVYLDPVALPLQFLDLPPDELNLRILRFDSVVDTFLREHRVHFDPKYKPSRAWMDSLDAAVHAAMAADGPQQTEGADFFGRYAGYTLAEMRYVMRFASRKGMMERYVLGSPILYHDENYMRLLLSLLDGMVSLGTPKLPKWQLAEWVNGGRTDVYLDSLGTDPLLQDEQVRELAALVALKESYYDADYDRAGVRRMVQQIGAQSKFAEHRTLAARLEKSFLRAEKGEQAPTLALPDTSGTQVQLDSLRGKWVYLSFVRVGDAACQRELETMAFFHDSVCAGGQVAFVSVSCDRDVQKMLDFLRHNKYGRRCHWLWLHFDGDYRLLERYGVVSFPTFILLDPEGRLHYSVTPPPASGILMHGPWEQPKEAPKDVLPFLNQE